MPIPTPVPGSAAWYQMIMQQGVAARPPQQPTQPPFYVGGVYGVGGGGQGGYTPSPPNYNVPYVPGPATYQSQWAAAGGLPSAPAAPGGGGGGGGVGGAAFNGHYAEGPFGNWMDEFGTWHDAWGNTIPHAGYVPGGGGPGTPPELRYLVDQNPDGTPIVQEGPYGVPSTPPAPPVEPVPPVTVMPTTFYQPMGQTNSLQLSNQFLALLDSNTRLALDEQLQRARFAPTGQIGQYGETTYLVNGAEDLSQILDPNLRQWIRWFLGQLGYGATYQLPSSYAGGIPAAPPTGYQEPPVPRQPAPPPLIPASSTTSNVSPG